MVSVDIPLGSEVLSALDTAGLNINVALWAQLSGYEDWWFVIASRKLDKEKDTIRRYRIANAATGAAGIGVRRAPDIMILKMTDPFIKELRRSYAKTGDAEGMRLSGRFGRYYIEDSYVYRIT